MKRISFALFLVATLCAGACRRETAQQQPQTATGGDVRTTTVAGEPRDLTKARVNAVIAPDTGQYVTNARIGSAVGADGLVSEEQTEFAAGDDIHLSLWLKESPKGLVTSATVQNASGEEVDVERKPMNGGKTVTFALGDKKLKAGKYKVTGYWGGNIAAEYDITVSGAKAKAPSKTPAKASGKAKTR